MCRENVVSTPKCPWCGDDESSTAACWSNGITFSTKPLWAEAVSVGQDWGSDCARAPCLLQLVLPKINVTNSLLCIWIDLVLLRNWFSVFLFIERGHIFISLCQALTFSFLHLQCCCLPPVPQFASPAFSSFFWMLWPDFLSLVSPYPESLCVNIQPYCSNVRLCSILAYSLFFVVFFLYFHLFHGPLVFDTLIWYSVGFLFALFASDCL